MDFQSLGNLDFGKPNCDIFKCLKLAFQAGQMGGTMPCVMNAANEVAVQKFLSGDIKFLDIAKIIEITMDKFKPEKVESLNQLIEVDKQARNISDTIN